MSLGGCLLVSRAVTCCSLHSFSTGLEVAYDSINHIGSSRPNLSVLLAWLYNDSIWMCVLFSHPHLSFTAKLREVEGDTSLFTSKHSDTQVFVTFHFRWAGELLFLQTAASPSTSQSHSLTRLLCLWSCYVVCDPKDNKVDCPMVL